jgi:hypothetical protein
MSTSMLKELPNGVTKLTLIHELEGAPAADGVGCSATLKP